MKKRTNQLRMSSFEWFNAIIINQIVNSKMSFISVDVIFIFSYRPLHIQTMHKLYMWQSDNLIEYYYYHFALYYYYTLLGLGFSEIFHKDLMILCFCFVFWLMCFSYLLRKIRIQWEIKFLCILTLAELSSGFQ